MRSKTVRTNDLLRLLHAVTTLQDRGSGEEGMGLLHGEPGTGKTTSICYAVNQTRGVFVRARVTWGITSMLQGLCRELEIPPHPHRNPMADAICEALTVDPRPIFVDEADYLLRATRGQTQMLDALRDIYDTAQVPIILIGMEEIEQTMRTQKKYARFDRRLTERVKFQGLSVTDAQKTAGELCEVHVEGAMPETGRPGQVAHQGTLVELLWKQTKGNIGYLVRELSKVERLGKASGLTTVTLEDWENATRPRAPRAVAA